MRILGLDPGLRHTGWGVIDVRGVHLSFVACGVAHPPGADQGMAERLKGLHEALTKVLQAHRPDEAAVEETFLNKNPGSTLKLGHARGVVLLAPALFGLPVAEYSAKSVKQSVVGTGAATKEQIGMMVRTLLPGSDPPSEDAADALAVAICHGHRAGVERSWRGGIGAGTATGTAARTAAETAG
ncbi:MAG: crossover junction endodeoxyribonuclease RuvC [Alphaproteobacteria bacterium]|nr:crossover junction endodeoxyribonuclease RuvC [Alphaproteobacteria bacterium]